MNTIIQRTRINGVNPPLTPNSCSEHERAVALPASDLEHLRASRDTPDVADEVHAVLELGMQDGADLCGLVPNVLRDEEVEVEFSRHVELENRFRGLIRYWLSYAARPVLCSGFWLPSYRRMWCKEGCISGVLALSHTHNVREMQRLQKPVTVSTAPPRRHLKALSPRLSVTPCHA